jgi:tetratricopeptide (TPR) repeat protein
MNRCLDENELALMVWGQLPPSRTAGLEEHLDRCTDCRQLVAEVTRLGLVDPAPARPPAPGPMAWDPHASTLPAPVQRPATATAPTVDLADPHAGAPAEMLQTGMSFGRYLITGWLGSGGMSMVYRAFDPELDRKVALKVLRSHHTGLDPSPRLLREAQAMAQISHPNVIAIYDVGVDGGQLFLAMELVEGTTLTHWVGLKARSVKEVLAVYLQAGRGLVAAHQAGLIHRDFKPDNVLIGNDGRVRVTDFGLARASDEEGDTGAGVATSVLAASDGRDRRLTQTGAIIGTPRYMAPEQHLRQAADARSDQYSYCLALYEALYGERPFAGASLIELRESALANAIRPPPRGSHVPGWLRQALLRGLRASRDERYPSMTPLLQVLARGLKGRLRTRLIVVSTAAAVLAAAMGLRWLELHAITCRAGEQELQAVWNEPRRHALHQALLATGRPYAPTAAVGTERRIQRFVSRWQRIHRDVCEAVAAPARVPGGEATGARRLDCLRGRLGELDETLRLLSANPGELVERSAQTAAGLSEAEVCTAPELAFGAAAGEAAPAPTFDVEKRMARVRALRLAGRVQEGREQARALLLDLQGPVSATATVDPFALLAAVGTRLAEAHELRGELELLGGDTAAAEAALDRAVLLAERAGRDDIKARALSLLLQVLARSQGREAEVARVMSLAQAAVQRAGAPASLRLLLATSRASLLFQQRKYALALPSMDEAIAIVRASTAKGGDPDPQIGHLERRLAVLLLRLGRFPQALAHFQAALQLHTSLLGADHPAVVGSLLGLGGCLARLGRPAAARRELDRALAAKVEPGHPLRVQVLRELGELQLEEGDQVGAIQSYGRARQENVARLGPDAPELGFDLSGLARARLAAGEVRPAIDLLERALVLLEQPRPHGSGPDPLRPVVIAQAHARFALARALMAEPASPASPSAPPFSSWPRARELAVAARAAYATEITSQLDRQRAERWLAATDRETRRKAQPQPAPRPGRSRAAAGRPRGR